MEREDLLIRTFVELADNLVVEFDVVDVLTTLASRGVVLLGVDAAGILLSHDGGKLRLVAASSEDGAMLELFELQAERGPAFECFDSGVPQSIADLSLSPWPELADRGGGRSACTRPKHGRCASGTPSSARSTCWAPRRAASIPPTRQWRRPWRMRRRSASCSTAPSGTLGC